MEHSELLIATAKTYVDKMHAVKATSDYGELDKARLDALKAFQDLERQLNRARPDLVRLAREQRATIATAKATARKHTFAKLKETIADAPAVQRIVVKDTEKKAKKAKKAKK